jgi:hypothetical protein
MTSICHVSAPREAVCDIAFAGLLPESDWE